MQDAFLSQFWYRVANSRPRLRNHARFFRTHYRGKLWYVLQDRTSGRFHRFSPSSFFITSLLDGKRTLDEIWSIICAQLEDESLTQDKVLELLGQLHNADVLYADSVPDIQEMVDRGHKQRTKKRVMSVLNPLALRLPLLDPENFLKLTMPFVRPFLSLPGLVLYLAVVIYGASLAVTHWDALTSNVLDRLLTTENLLLILVTYPVVKAIHELGHAYTITRWGGEVHEMGIMFLVFMPVPYVDASDSLAFQSKWRRALVAGAGILVEIMLAAIAMIIWVNAEDGLVRAFAFNTMLIGGASTLFFNGNPLLRFDGYYVLSDLLEIPNLGSRSNQYIGYVIQKRLLGIKDARNPATARGEPFWFVTYGIAAFVYRLFIAATIILLVSSQFFSLGIILGIWAAVLMFVVPLSKQVWFLLASPKLRRRRGRALAVTGTVIGAIAAAIFFIPLPYSTIAEGVVWVPGDGAIHASTEGVVDQVVVKQGEEVVPGDVLVQLNDPLLNARVDLLLVTVAELQQRRDSLLFSDPAAARIAERELEHALADLELAQSRQQDLSVRAPTTGRVALLETSDMPGRYVNKGQLLGYVSTFQDPMIRAIVSEDSSDLILQGTTSIDIRLISAPATTHAARIEREVPALDATLPSLALATVGGGSVLLDPSSPRAQRSVENLLHLDLKIRNSYEFETIGERAYVRFVHEPVSLSTRIHRRVRQVFLRHFNI
ncbi:MAG: PqqD family peptide modification chaperone [Pseudomonadota bacterium]